MLVLYTKFPIDYFFKDPLNILLLIKLHWDYCLKKKNYDYD